MMFVGYLMSIITLEIIVEQMYYARRIFNVNPNTEENCRVNVLCLSDI